jgi:hypothetical protein
MEFTRVGDVRSVHFNLNLSSGSATVAVAVTSPDSFGVDQHHAQPRAGAGPAVATAWEFARKNWFVSDVKLCY